MYKRFFQLHSVPFGSSPDPYFLHVMPHTQEALAGLQYGISTRKGFIVLTGEVGTGKTTLLRRTLSTFDDHHVLSAFVFNPLLDILDFLEFVLNDFGIVPTSRSKGAMLIQLNRWLIERYREGRICVILIDEAQNLSWELLEEVRLLTNLETASEKLVQIVLSGQPELEDKLRQPNARQLRQRVALWCRTQSLNEAETKAYIEQRLHLAGATRAIFLPEAMELIHRASHGIPRIINLICEHALILGYVEELRRLPAALIAAVVQDLDLHPFLVPSTVASGKAEREMPPAQHGPPAAPTTAHVERTILDSDPGRLNR